MERFIYQPTISVLARPVFTEPAHLKVNWLGDASDAERLCEYAGRLCYMSQRNPGGKTTLAYLTNIRAQRHGSVFEHANFSLLFEGVSRSLTHELVRHRAGWAYSQLSQRYVDEADTMFVVPPELIGTGKLEEDWQRDMCGAAATYAVYSDRLLARLERVTDKVERRKKARQAARSVLPNATETKIVATANVRAWRTMLELRSNEGADLEIRRLACMVIELLQHEAPAFFDDFSFYLADDGHQAARCASSKV